MPFFGNTQVPQIGDKIRITTYGEPSFILEVTVIGRWVIDQMIPTHINFAFLLPRDTFPLELARHAVILDTTKEKWFFHIKDGEITVIQEVTVDIIRD